MRASCFERELGGYHLGKARVSRGSRAQHLEARPHYSALVRSHERGRCRGPALLHAELEHGFLAAVDRAAEGHQGRITVRRDACRPEAELALGDNAGAALAPIALLKTAEAREEMNRLRHADDADPGFELDTQPGRDGLPSLADVIELAITLTEQAPDQRDGNRAWLKLERGALLDQQAAARSRTEPP